MPEYPASSTPSPIALSLTSGRWYTGNLIANNSGFTLIQADVFYMPISFIAGATLTKLGINISGAGTSGSVVRLGVYTDNGKGSPGVLVKDYGTVAGTSATFVSTTAFTQGLPPGAYWFACCGQGSPATQPNVWATYENYTQVGQTTSTDLNVPGYLGSTTATGALPSTPGTVTDYSAVPIVYGLAA